MDSQGVTVEVNTVESIHLPSPKTLNLQKQLIRIA